MTRKSGVKAVLWMLPGAAVMLSFILVAAHFYKEQNPAEQLAFKARRVDLVGRMQLALASASEAEKSAVLAITDQDSQTFADQARAATAQLEQERRELEELLKAGGTKSEKDLLAQFSEVFAELQRIDNEVLSLAVKNTNLKAYSLAFGPAADALEEMDAALSRVVAAHADSPDAKKVMLLAFGARIGALRIQTLLPPHIAEESDQKMDELEALMAKEDKQVRQDLDGLAALPELEGDADLATAVSRYARFTKIKTQILALSRENTNVRSLAISLNQKRKAMILCQDALSALKQAILEEPIAGVTYGPPPTPGSYTDSPSSLYLRCRYAALLDVPPGTPASSPRCRPGHPAEGWVGHLEFESVLDHREYGEVKAKQRKSGNKDLFFQLFRTCADVTDAHLSCRTQPSFGWSMAMRRQSKKLHHP